MYNIKTTSISEKMKKKYHTVCEDLFLDTGVSSILDKIDSLTDDNIFNKGIYSFLLFSDQHLFGLVEFFKKINPERTYIVIAPHTIWPLLKSIEILRFVKFIDISLSVSSIEYELQIFLKESKNQVTELTHPKLPRLTVKERIILERILTGFNLTIISKENGVSVKTISTQKRNIMKKLHVRSNQQLYIKEKITKILDCNLNSLIKKND